MSKAIMAEADGLRCRDFGCAVCTNCGRSFFGDKKAFEAHAKICRKIIEIEDGTLDVCECGSKKLDPVLIENRKYKQWGLQCQKCFVIYVTKK